MAPPNWEATIKKIVDNVGLLRLMQYVSKLPSVSRRVIVKEAMKLNLEEVGSTRVCYHFDMEELIKHVTKKTPLSQILERYSLCAINRAFTDLLPHTSEKIQLTEIHREICPMIRNYPPNVMAVVQIGNAIVRRIRIAESDDIDYFNLILYNCPFEPIVIYRRANKRSLPVTVDDVFGTILECINEGLISDEQEKRLTEAIFKRLSTQRLEDAYNAEMKRRRK